MRHGSAATCTTAPRLAASASPACRLLLVVTSGRLVVARFGDAMAAITPLGRLIRQGAVEAAKLGGFHGLAVRLADGWRIGGEADGLILAAGRKARGE